jgi:hypothetical protein
VSLPGKLSGFLVDASRVNRDIEDGGWRALKLRQEPFSLQADLLANYEVLSRKGIFSLRFQKEVLFWENAINGADATV